MRKHVVELEIYDHLQVLDLDEVVVIPYSRDEPQNYLNAKPDKQ